MDQRGSVLVEFAIAIPALVLLVVGMADYGAAVAEKVRLISATRAGAQYALTHSSDLAGIEATIRAASGVQNTALSITAQQICGCANGTNVACSAQCADASNRRTYMSVQVQETYVTPSFAIPVTMISTTTIRTD